MVFNLILNLSFLSCLSIAMIGMISGICGFRKGYKITAASIIIYFLITLTGFILGWQP